MMLWRNVSFATLCVVITACASPPVAMERQVYSIAVPGTSLVLEFPSAGFKLEVADNNPPYYYFTNEKAKLSLSFSIERAIKCSSSEACRDYFVNKIGASDASKKNRQLSRIGEIFISENMDGSAENSNPRQRYMNAHFVKEGMWINVRLSKAAYVETDRELFMKLVRSIQFWPKLRE